MIIRLRMFFTFFPFSIIHMALHGVYDGTMPIPIYQIDSFTAERFAGNPAAVCVLQEPADDGWMQNVAIEMNLSETAFIRRLPEQSDHAWELRWFTPGCEVDLCGHATLASAHALWETQRVPRAVAIQFHSPRSGLLPCVQRTIDGEAWIEMDFPIDVPTQSPPPEGLLEALGVEPVSTHHGKWDPLIELASEADVLQVSPDFRAMFRCDMRGVTITAAADEANRNRYDFVSRFFAPACGVDEDPVTGSAHCQLGAFWAEQFGKSELIGYQASKRGGIVRVTIDNDRARIAGQSVLVFSGELC